MKQVQDERRRAHAKHRSSSMEAEAWNSPRAPWIFLEELGEMADHTHEAMRSTNPPTEQYQHLVKAWDEGIQAMTMFVLILDKLDQEMRRRRMAGTHVQQTTRLHRQEYPPIPQDMHPPRMGADHLYGIETRCGCSEHGPCPEHGGPSE